MLHPAYIAGWERKPCRVCGKVLYPMTLGHARVLYYADSPVVVPGEGGCSFDDVLLAVCLLSMPVPPTVTELPRVAEQARGFSSFDVTEEATAFNGYLQYYCQGLPVFSETPRAARPGRLLITPYCGGSMATASRPPGGSCARKRFGWGKPWRFRTATGNMQRSRCRKRSC